jgi:hypothetical protein
LEKNPQYRLKSVMALERIAFFHNFSMDDVRHKKVREKSFISHFHLFITLLLSPHFYITDFAEEID